MKYEYFIEEFRPDTNVEDINLWLKEAGEKGWEVVNALSMLHMVGGVTGVLTVAPTPLLGYSFLMKRPVK